MPLRQAQKAISKLRIGLAGPSGSGKTYSALLLASGMTKWNKICVLDTENNSADLYSDLGKYNVISMDAPFSPEKYIAAIKEAEVAGMEVIIIDSITHEWTEAKNMVDKLGGRFQDWAKVTPIHDRFVNAIVSSKCHIITTVRSKVDYSMTTEGGKTKVQKVGLKAEAREGFEYELTVSFDLNINHLAEASKDRTGLFMDADPGTITKEHGKKLLKWSNTGVDPAKLAREIEELIPTKEMKYDLEGLKTLYKVDDLADLAYATLETLKAKIEKCPPKKEQPPANPLDAIPDDLIPPKKPAETVKPVESTEVEVDALPDPITPPSPGDIKMFEIALQKRSEQSGKPYNEMYEAYLDKLKVTGLNQLPASYVKKSTDKLIQINAEFAPVPPKPPMPDTPFEEPIDVDEVFMPPALSKPVQEEL